MPIQWFNTVTNFRSSDYLGAICCLYDLV